MKISDIVAINQKYGFQLNFVALFLVSVTRAERDVGPRFFFETDSFFSEPSKDIPGPEKNYTGIRISNDSRLIIYDHDQTLAIIEEDSRSEKFINCELLEVRTAKDKLFALRDLTYIRAQVIKVNFNAMINLMRICHRLDLPSGLLSEQFIKRETDNNFRKRRSKRVGFEVLAIFKGIVPGTKWCGFGDKAGSYHDLGSNRQLDKCCRTHDYCPVKILGFKKQYNIVNYSYSTRSHCMCDELFYNCLKSLNTTAANIIGNIFFGSITCLENVNGIQNDPKKPNMVFVKKDMPF